MLLAGVTEAARFLAVSDDGVDPRKKETVEAGLELGVADTRKLVTADHPDGMNRFAGGRELNGRGEETGESTAELLSSESENKLILISRVRSPVAVAKLQLSRGSAGFVDGNGLRNLEDPARGQARLATVLDALESGFLFFATGAYRGFLVLEGLKGATLER